MKKVIRFVAIFYIVAVLFSAWGYSVARYKVFPSSIIEPYLDEVIAFLKGGDGEDKTMAQRLCVIPGTQYLIIGATMRASFKGWLLISFRGRDTEILLERVYQ